MLLSLMRKHAKSWLIKFLMVIISLVFIFYFGYNFDEDRGAKVAEVNGEIISRLEYDKAYNDRLSDLQDQYRNVWDNNLIKIFDLENRALEELIEKKLISQEARKIGLDVTESEVQEKIMEIPAFQSDGFFDKGKYRAILSSNRMELEDFEESFSHDLLQQKLIQFLMTFSIISEQDILDYYRYANESVSLSFVNFSPENYRDSVSIDQELMNKFFEDRKEDYRIPEKIKLAYINIDPDQFRDQVKLEDTDITNFYELNTDMFLEEKQIKARHILFRIPEGASPEDETAIMEKAHSVLLKAKEGADFAELAKEYSEGPTKDMGGDLGYFPRGRIIKEIEDVAFSLEKGQISDPFKTSFGYQILKVEDIQESRTKELEEVRDQIVNILTRNESLDLANSKALSLIDQMPYDANLAQFAEQHKVQVADTDFFPRNNPAAIIQGDEKLLDTLFSFEKNNTSEVIEINNSYYIIQVSDTKESYLPELDEVLDQVTGDYIQHASLLQAKSEAEKYLESLKGGREWNDLLQEMNVTADSTGFFTRQQAPEKIGTAPGIQDAAFKLNETNRYPDTVFENDKGAYVIRWEGKKDIDESLYQDEKAKYSDALMKQRQQDIFRAWIERLKNDAEIDRSNFKRSYS